MTRRYFANRGAHFLSHKLPRHVAESFDLSVATIVPRREMFPGRCPDFAMNELMLRGFCTAAMTRGRPDCIGGKCFGETISIDPEKAVLVGGRTAAAPAGAGPCLLRASMLSPSSNPKAAMYTSPQRSENPLAAPGNHNSGI